VGTKKKELVESFYRDGKLYTQKALEVFDYDFPSAARARATNFLALVSCAVRNDLSAVRNDLSAVRNDLSADRNDLDVWAYVKDVLDRLLASETDYAALRPDVWRVAHLEAIREYRVAERRDRADRKQYRRAARRRNTPSLRTDRTPRPAQPPAATR